MLKSEVSFLKLFAFANVNSFFVVIILEDKLQISNQIAICRKEFIHNTLVFIKKCCLGQALSNIIDFKRRSTNRFGHLKLDSVGSKPEKS